MAWGFAPCHKVGHGKKIHSQANRQQILAVAPTLQLHSAASGAATDTREGQVLYDYSKQILQAYGSLDSKLQELKDIISGTIRVATVYSIGLHDLPPYIEKFMMSYPMVNVHVEYPNLKTKGRYVRINCKTRTMEYGFSLWEFQVFGK